MAWSRGGRIGWCTCSITSYTQQSLGWDRLKNADRIRVEALREVAERLDCEAFLALADVHESWSCEDDWESGYGRDDERKALIEILTDPSIGLPLLAAGDLLRGCCQGGDREQVKALGLRGLHAHVQRAIEGALKAPPRAADDWSIKARLECKCPLCAELRAFLSARDRVVYAWPLAQSSRAHVHRTIDFHRLPVTHQTRRTGRPYTLVLEKTREVHTQAAALRREQESLLGWLKENRGWFA